MINSYPFFSQPYTSDMAQGIYILDQYIRQDICEGCIQSEVDYVSTLMAYIRLFFRSKQLAKQIYGFKIQRSNDDSYSSQVLNKSLERKFGCDALIIFRAGDKVKVCMFEAKYPKLKMKSNWDKYQKNDMPSHYTNQEISHFHHQLRRQQKWARVAFIWELFINDHPPGSPLKFFDTYGSTCIWHKDAYEYSESHINRIDKYDHKTKKPELWDNSYLKDCLEHLPYNPLNLEEIFNTVLFKNEGKEIKIKDGFISLEPEDGQQINIPVTIDLIRDYQYKIFEEAGVREFLFIELKNIVFSNTNSM